MSKTRLSGIKRDSIMAYMKRRYNERHDSRPEDDAFTTMVKLVNDAVRNKYPEEDMVILRKYRCEYRDLCLRFQQTSTGRVFGVEFYARSDGLADLPRLHGCNSRDVFPAGDDLLNAYEVHEKLRDDNKRQREVKFAEYAAFLAACATVEDVEAVVPLPADLRTALTGSSTALVAISQESVADLRAEFSEAA